MNWTVENIPDLTDQVAIVTGSTSGLGVETARVLAAKGATVVMAVRDTAKGETAADRIRTRHPDARLEVRALDLADLGSVKAFADGFAAGHDRLDLLVNNAGVMMCPYSQTRDGFEIQMGTNHFGHFALTGHLLPLLKKTDGSRVVSVASIAHRAGRIDFTDINWEKRRYATSRAYGDSKLANLLFTYELARRLARDADGPRVTAAHPGWTATELQRHSGSARFLNRFFAQDSEMGTLPTLRAAFDQEARSGDYYGPSRFLEMNGYPVKVNSNARSRDQDAAAKLWALSEDMTGVRY